MAKPIEKKVSIASALTFIGTTAAYAVVSAFTDPQVLSAVPDAVDPIIVAASSALLTFIGGYMAPHTPQK